MFYEQFERLCNKNGTTPTEFTTKILQLSSSKVTAWKNGSIPKYGILDSISKYFGVTIGYLFDGPQKHIIDDLTENEATILELFKCLTQTQQGEIIGRAKMMIEQNESVFCKEDAG